jgi:hypothetical protein
VIGQRLELARAQLVSPPAGDASHFTRRFRPSYGTTPREWQTSSFTPQGWHSADHSKN